MIDLCVVSYNNIRQLPRLVHTLYESLGVVPYNQWRLHIADNGSTDGTVDWLKTLDSKIYLDTLALNHNVGYAAACNALAAEGDGDIIALLNADVWFKTRDLAAIATQFEKNPDMAVLGPKQRDEKGSITHAGIFGSNDRPRHRGWREADPYDEKYRDRLPAVTVSGSAYFIRRSVWDEMTNCPVYRSLYLDTDGAFLPTPHYFEETWCSYHVREHGHEVIYDGRVSIGHTWHASSQIGAEADQLFRTSQRIFRLACDHHGIIHD